MIFTRSNIPLLTALALFWVIGVLCLTAMGPFGTYETLDFWPRFAYWALIALVSCALDATMRLAFPVTQLFAFLLRRFVFVITFSACLFVINRATFQRWQSFDDFLLALYYVLIVSICIEMVLAALRAMLGAGRRASTQAEAVLPALETLMDKLPENIRGDIWHLEARGHYLGLLTDKGEAQILMRFSDAIISLPESLGIQTHRSHWVGLNAAKTLTRAQGKPFVQLEGGKLVPVSKARLNAVESALMHDKVAGIMGKF